MIMKKTLLIFLFFILCLLSFSQSKTRIFVFGDSHVQSGLGKYIGEEFQKNSNVVYDYYGINGASFSNDFKFKKSALLDQIKKFNPDVILCFLGTNESNDRKVLAKNMNSFLHEIDVKKLIIISPPYYKYDNIKNVAIGMKSYCHINNIKYIDIFDPNYSVLYELIDKYHFTQYGYKTLAKFIVKLYK